MKPESLEMLAMDRAFGELTSQAEELLDSWLAEHPDAAQSAAVVEDALALTRRVLPKETSLRGSMLEFSSLLAEQKRSESRAYFRQWLQLAACLLVGLGVGWHLADVPSRPAPIAAVYPSPAPAPVANAMPEAQDTGGIWSVAAWRQRESRPINRPSYTLVWNSPVRRPILKENP